MDKRTLFGGGAAAGVVLLFCVGTLVKTGQSAANPLDSPLPPGAVQFSAGEKPSPKQIAVEPRRDTLLSPEPATPAASPSTAPLTASTPTPSEVVVFVSGAVKKPGVYHLKPGARIEGAIFAAGGFKSNAQTDALNLADFAQDGDQLNVPVLQKSNTSDVDTSAALSTSSLVTHVASMTSASSPVKPGRVLGKAASSHQSESGMSAKSPRGGAGHAHPAGPTKFKTAGDGVVNLNTASLEELLRLPGVGAATAQHIVDYRQQIGPFDDITQLQQIKGIGAKKYAQIEPFVKVK